MATLNPFDLLGEDDTDDLSVLIAAQQKKLEAMKTVPAAPVKPAAAAGAKAKLPSKPLPPAQAVREAKSESGRGGRGGGRGYGRGRGAGGRSYRDSSNSENSYGNREISAGQGASDEVDAEKPYEKRGGYGGSRVTFRDGQPGGFSNGEGERYRDGPRRPFERRGGTGRGNENRREGSGQGNWGNQTDEPTQLVEVVNGDEKKLNTEKPSGVEEAAADGEKEEVTKEVEEKEPEDKEMTLEEYEKVLEEKRKALNAPKTEERKVDVKEFETMQQLANKKANDEIFVKLGSEKEKKKELAEKEERAKKSVSINEFLKPADGARHNNGGRGRGRGHGSRGGYGGGGSEMRNVRAPSIEDPGQFPTLGGK